MLIIETTDILSTPAQIIASPFSSFRFSFLKRELCQSKTFPECRSGRIRLRKCENNSHKYLLALYFENDNESFTTCLSKILTCIKNISSIAFSEKDLTEENIENLKEWEEENSIQVFLHQKEKHDYTDISLKDYTLKNIPYGWEDFFNEVIEKGDLDVISNFLKEEVDKGYTIFPPLPEIYTAFDVCPPQKIKVIIIGQDPYHTPGAAMGLAFGHHSSRRKIQPSLKNIYKELKDDLPATSINTRSGNLLPWAKQGVFLINTALTVRKGEAKSHGTKKSGWNNFTDHLFRYLNRKCDRLVVIMWGNHAKSYKKLFDKKHFKFSSMHPSPFSAYGFFGTKPFSHTNNQLKKWGKKPIDWDV